MANPPSNPQAPHEVTLGGKLYPITWEHDGANWIVSCLPDRADADLVGFGETFELAIKDLLLAYSDLVAFADDCRSDWWAATYR